jgi:hypothetical protein
MRRYFIAFVLAWLAFVCWLTLTPSHATRWYWCNQLTGGVSNSVDSISSGRLSGGDLASAVTFDPHSGSTDFLLFEWTGGVTASENVAHHPYIIQADTMPALGLWTEVNLGSGVSRLLVPSVRTCIMGGTTADVSWSADATSGDSGWHLTDEHLLTYANYYVETSFPGGDVSGGTPYSDSCPVGPGGSGLTIYLPEIQNYYDGREWKSITSKAQ